MVFGADMFASWLLGQVADGSLARLKGWVLGSDQERALRWAAIAAVQGTAAELKPQDPDEAAYIALIIGQVFGRPVPDASLTFHPTLLGAIEAGIAVQLAPLGDAELTGTGRSSADLLGVSVAELSEQLTRHLLREIDARGASGSPLAPLASTAAAIR